MPEDCKKSFRRLPVDVLPYHYDIKLIPNLTTYILYGCEDIYVDIKQSTDTIVLNAQNINIEKATFHKKDGSETTATTVELSTSEETAKMIFPESLPVGREGHLSINFTGEIGDNLKGMYRSKYIGDNGEVKYAIVTQFEPTDARRCFPCWDEPLHKATFNISVEVSSGLIAISNMPIKNKTTDGSKETINFEKTPIMSTYLIAIMIGEFDYVEGESKDGVLVRIYTAKGKQEQGKFALDVTTRALPYYKSYFGIAYPLAKVDLIAVKDTSFGAMENWGAIIYRDTCLLVEPHHTSTVNKQNIAVVVAHELAHQWFGNLVTMKWWTHLWLNEGYATFSEYLCVDHLFPEYQVWNQFVTDVFSTALQLDALKNSHPIEVPVEHPGEINEVFDTISYRKGASIIRMLYSFIGDEKFRKGMNLYLNRHIYSNAETEDLWAALENASNKPIRKIMPTWTKQQGFPIVKVEQRQDGANRILSLSQERFLADGSADIGNNLWLIPITVSTMQNPNDIVFDAVMENKTAEFLIKDVPENNWVKLNPGAVGFYRTHYSEDMMKLLLPSIRNRTLPPLDRLGIYDDTFAMVQAGQISTVELLRLTQSFQEEDNSLVWTNIIDSLHKISVIVSNSDFEEAYQTFVRKLLRNVSQTFGWDPKPNENHLDSIFRMLVLKCMVDFNDEETIKEAKKRFEQHLSGTKILAVDVRSVVYRAVLSVGNSDTYESMLRLYRKTDLDEEKERILRALGALKDEILLTKAFDFIISDEVNTSGILEAVSSLGLTYPGRVLTWEFIKRNWKILIERFASGLILPKLIKYSTQYFITEDYARDIENFFKDNSVPGTERTIQQSLETIRLQAAWFERDRNTLKEYLVSHT